MIYVAIYHECQEKYVTKREFVKRKSFCFQKNHKSSTAPTDSSGETDKNLRKKKLRGVYEDHIIKRFQVSLSAHIVARNIT